MNYYRNHQVVCAHTIALIMLVGYNGGFSGSRLEDLQNRVVTLPLAGMEEYI